MNWTRQVRTWHKWISVVVGLQLLTWTTSGLIFTLDPIDDVRGETYVAAEDAPALPDMTSLIPLSAARANAGAETATGAHLAWMRGRWVWVLDVPDKSSILVDARHDVVLESMPAEEAAGIARTRFTLSDEVASVAAVEHLGGEYKERPMPAWRVTFADDDETNIYVDATTGEITAVRSDTWRRFDFFWMLHIMDYDNRKDFHTPLLTGAAVLGVSTALTGLLLAVLVLWPRRRSA
jgi:hypothetical protein